jgi:hypothetical protein
MVGSTRDRSEAVTGLVEAGAKLSAESNPEQCCTCIPQMGGKQGGAHEGGDCKAREKPRWHGAVV